MRLAKLELQGFKSFADSTELRFDSGVTAIVGPNGCGKSNVSDAIRWVLGEQRARMMRGGKMEDIIFQGSSARRAVNVAEVSLFFENDDGSLPIAFQEVVITRRLSRSGESEYLLNRVPCRLRDIHDLLRGTGLGTEAGVVIESRMIDALLSDRPDDRRDLFEEAAGVGLYRDRRRSTERRLEETTGDLQRLDDLIGEVQSQVRALARQKKRSERHVELMRRRFTVEIALAGREMAAWADELARLETRVAALRAEVPTAEARRESLEHARTQAHGLRGAAEAQRAELARLTNSLRQQLLQLQGEMAVAEERQRNTLQRRQRAEEESREGSALGDRLGRDLGEATAERARLDAALEAANAALAQRVEAEEEARRLVLAARQEVELADAGMRELHERLRRLEHERERAQRERDEVAARAAQLDIERAQLADRTALVRREREAALVAAEASRTLVTQAQAELERAREEAREARERDGAARGELFRADEAHTALLGRVGALETLERERVGLAPAAASLLRERERFGDGAVIGPLSDFIAADQDTAAVVERFLGASLHGVLVRDEAAAEAIRAWHAETAPGPLLLLPADAVSGDDTEPDALATRVDAVGAGRAWVRTLLGHVHAVAGGSAFRDARGAIWLPGAAGGPGPLRRRAELVALRDDLSVAETARQAASREADARRAALEAAEAQATARAESAAEAERAARRADEHTGELDRRLERADRELREAEALAARLTDRSRELDEKLAAADAERGAAAETLAVHEARAAETRAQLAAAEEEQERARDSRTTMQVERAQIQARVQVSTDRERRLLEERATATSRLETLHAELHELSRSDSALAEQMASWRLELETRESTLGDAEARLLDAEAGLQQAEIALLTAERTLEESRRQATALSDELHHAELRFVELSGRRTAIRERLETEWRRPLETLLAESVPIEAEDDALRSEVEQLRAQLDQLGPVNALAVEEYDETVKRADFLTGQRTDLADAKASLQQAIREIDVTAKELFLATFTQVRENFRQIFMSLFGGGECDLRLENPDAPLDCDIEIHASPRGKKTQRIHLLSSGERALVALSLLFGIFLTKPSPFCLLDEVDAPLDDANVGRFVRMLTEFKQRTQFIVITHNPRTSTEAADAVYGVTMQEPGVSSLVSVRLRGGEAVEAIEEAIAGRISIEPEVAAAPA